MNHSRLVLVSDWLTQRSVTRPRTRPVSRSNVTRWNSCFFTTATVASRCRSRKRFYFSWNLSPNGSSKKFHEIDHVTRCIACWNLFRSAAAHKFQLKVSMCNGGLSHNYIQQNLTTFVTWAILLCHEDQRQTRPDSDSAQALWSVVGL